MASRVISVIGGADSNQSILLLAERIGEEIAKRGVALACGGLGGVMESACKGAKKHGGVTIGLLPSDDKKSANQYVDFALPTGLGYTRNFLVAKAGDAVIVSPGELHSVLNTGKDQVSFVAVYPASPIKEH